MSAEHIYQITFSDGRTHTYKSTTEKIEFSWQTKLGKEIPEIYINSSLEQRIALLQGLMDTDGTANMYGGISFCSTSKHMAEQVQQIVRSIGGMASISVKQPFFTHRGEKRWEG